MHGGFRTAIYGPTRIDEIADPLGPDLRAAIGQLIGDGMTYEVALIKALTKQRIQDSDVA